MNVMLSRKSFVFVMQSTLRNPKQTTLRLDQDVADVLAIRLAERRQKLNPLLNQFLRTWIDKGSTPLVVVPDKSETNPQAYSKADEQLLASMAYLESRSPETAAAMRALIRAAAKEAAKDARHSHAAEVAAIQERTRELEIATGVRQDPAPSHRSTAPHPARAANAARVKP